MRTNKDYKISIYEVSQSCWLCQYFLNSKIKDYCYGEKQICDQFILKESISPNDYIIDKIIDVKLAD